MDNFLKFEFSSAYKLATQLKSWMAINPSYGCIWDCGYCIQEKDSFFNGLKNKLVKTASAEDVISEIMSNPKIKSDTPLSFFNFSDPFIPQNTSDLRKILVELDNRDFTNPVGLITRTYADTKTLDVIANLKNLKTVVFTSYAGYTNKSIENAPNSKRINLIKNLSARDIKNILYMRPLVEEWLEPNQLERVKDEVGDYVDGVVMSGLRLTPEIVRKLQKKDVVVPKVKNFTNKYFPTNLQDKVIDVFKDVVPVFRYTSCGMSAVLNIPDYNAHLGKYKLSNKKSNHDCPLPCKQGQYKLCSGNDIYSDKKIKNILQEISPNLEYEIINNCIMLNEELPEQDITFIRHNTKKYVTYKKNCC